MSMWNQWIHIYSDAWSAVLICVTKVTSYIGSMLAVLASCKCGLYLAVHSECLTCPLLFRWRWWNDNTVISRIRLTTWTKCHSVWAVFHKIQMTFSRVCQVLWIYNHITMQSRLVYCRHYCVFDTLNHRSFLWELCTVFCLASTITVLQSVAVVRWNGEFPYTKVQMFKLETYAAAAELMMMMVKMMFRAE